jgi:hypothetical protein
MSLLLRATAGLWLWAFGFSLLYALHGLGCARHWNVMPLLGGTMFGWIMITAWLVLAAMAAALVWSARRAAPGLERRLSVTSAAVGLIGIVVTGSPVIAMSACI